jgi:hypothetical protein
MFQITIDISISPLSTKVKNKTARAIAFGPGNEGKSATDINA